MNDKQNENYAYYIFGQNLRKFRMEAGLTQEQLAEKKPIRTQLYKKSRK